MVRATVASDAAVERATPKKYHIGCANTRVLAQCAYAKPTVFGYPSALGACPECSIAPRWQHGRDCRGPLRVRRTTGVDQRARQSRASLDARSDRCPGDSPGQRAITPQVGTRLLQRSNDLVLRHVERGDELRIIAVRDGHLHFTH